MSLSLAELTLTLTEADEALRGGVVERVVDLDGPAFAFEVYAQRAKRWFLISSRPGYSRAHLAPSRPRGGPETPSGFVMLLRKRLIGARLVASSLSEIDRVARLHFAHREDRLALIAELTGRHANVFLCDEGERIILSLRPNLSRKRALVPGEAYVAPLHAEVASSALASAPRFGGPSGAGQAADALYTALEGSAGRRARAAEVERVLREAQKRIARRQAAIAGDRARAEAAEPFQKVGSLLIANQRLVARGADTVTLVDYSSEPPAEVAIPLDPSLSAKANAERYFARYRRFRDGLRQVAAQEERAAAEEARLRSLLERARAAIDVSLAHGDDAPLQALRQELVVRGLLRAEVKGKPGERVPRRSGAARKKKDAPAEPFRRYLSSDGKAIFVGKGARENDVLTFKVARGNDLWMHARDYPGSHVVVPLGRGEDASEAALLDAATLAAHYSRAKGATIVDVAYARRKYVHKPKGAPPGSVAMSESKTIAVRLEAGRLERLLRKVDLG